MTIPSYGMCHFDLQLEEPLLTSDSFASQSIQALTKVVHHGIDDICMLLTQKQHMARVSVEAIERKEEPFYLRTEKRTASHFTICGLWGRIGMPGGYPNQQAPLLCHPVRRRTCSHGCSFRSFCPCRYVSDHDHP